MPSPPRPGDKIKRVFVLMLENRSYDHLLGYLDLSGRDPLSGLALRAQGLAGDERNPDRAGAAPVPVSDTARDSLGFDPDHEFPSVRTQVCGPGGDYLHPTMKGFVLANGPRVMGCFKPERLPALATLAREYALCDHWFSALPGPTWPNRLFAHAATSGGLFCSPGDWATVGKITFGSYAFEHGTVFDALDAARKPWRIYHHGLPQSLTLAGMGLRYLATDDFRDFTQHFARDLASSSYAPAYTFIEPLYGGLTDSTFHEGNSQHPNGDIQDGEQLIRAVYGAIRRSPLWAESLLLITYDEHGGLYDHVRPPSCAPPGDSPRYAHENGAGLSFDFGTYGVRVPAVVVSPWIPRNTVDKAVYDHSSISRTLNQLFKTRTLTRRDAHANDLVHLLALDVPRAQDAPLDLPAPPPALPALPKPAVEAGDLPVEGLEKHILGLGGSVRAVLDNSAALDAGGMPTDADKLQRATLSALAGVTTRAQAADFLQKVHTDVLAARTAKGANKAA